jgi:hypothetical protein
MFSKIYHICTQSAKGKNLLILLSAYILITVVLLQWTVASLMMDAALSQLIDWQFDYSVEEVYALLKSYGSESREWYILIELTLNTIIPFIYASLFGFAIILVFKKLPVKEQLIKSILLFPLVALVADLIENICIILLLINYPYKLILIARAANIFTYTKWVLILANTALISMGALLVSFRYLRFKFVPKSISQ